MRFMFAVRPIVVAAILMGFSPSAGAQNAGAQTDSDMARLDRAVAAFSKGDQTSALALAEGVLAHSPDDLTALFRSATFNFYLDNSEAARGRLERLVKLSGNYFYAWELMVQVAQAQGDLARRNEAVARLKVAIASAIDPDIRRKSDFIRDKIRIGDRDLRAVDYFTRGGSDFTRYQFGPGDPRLNPEKGLLLRTDAVTTETWSATALLPPDKQLFHLDLVDPRPEGGEKVAVYQYYVGEPDYDTVRAEMMRVLRGEVQPLSGEPGSLSGILKR